ncbi:hypothetical protein Lal_00021307 [Lupinus albus]|nr:hypothetical protein Lal_00021307 [Lupinus albus]
MFAATSSTPLSTYDSQHYHRSTMPSTNIFGTQHIDDEIVVEDVDDEDEEDEEEPQLTTHDRGRISQWNEQQLIVQPPKRRKSYACGTSSHRRH